MTSFCIRRWHAWTSVERPSLATCANYYQGPALIDDIPAMMRRRLPQVAKYIHSLMGLCGRDQVPTLFASTNGELSRTLKLIRSYDEDVSPAEFSMSVHNAIAGVLSVASGDRSDYSVIDSLSGVLETALIEAASRLQQTPCIRVVYFEEPLVDEFQDHGKDDAAMAAVLVMMIEPGETFTIQSLLPTDEQPDDAIDPIPGFAQLIRFLANPQTAQVMTRHCGRLDWCWQRHATT